MEKGKNVRLFWSILRASREKLFEEGEENNYEEENIRHLHSNE